MPSTILPDRRVTNAEASAMTGYSPERLDKLERRGQYAKRYDPRPYHVSDLAGRESHFGGLVASGTHTLSLWNELRFEAEAGLDELAGVGLDEVRYPRPVRPGDRLSLRAECIAKQLSQSKPDRGTLTFRHEISNQNGELVLSLLVQTIVAR